MIWDYIIIGAGSAGCALAHELAKSGKKQRILILEAGGSDRSPLIKLPMWQPRASLIHDWGYQSQPDPTRNGASERWKRGRVLGGSSSINGMIYIRGASEDFDRWSERCGHAGGWSADEVLPIFRDFERSDQNSPWRGKSGRLHVTTVKHPHRVTEAFIESACAAGYLFNPDYNGRRQEGVSYLQRSLRRGFRCSAADAFLRPLLARGDVTLLLQAFVEQIEIVDGRARAVSFLHRGSRRREAAHEVVLCAGAINSPKLLMLSGIGAAGELRRHGIDAVIDLPGVGLGLKEHAVTRLVFRSKVPTYNLTEGLLQRLAIFTKFVKYGEGPISVVYEGAAFLKTAATDPGPNVQLLFAPLAVLGKMGGAIALAPFPAFMIVMVSSHPASSGCIRLANRNPNSAPLIECRILENPADVDTIARGIGMVREIVKAKPLSALIEEELQPGPAVQGGVDLSCYVRDHTEVCFHPIGTCRMGIDQGAVVDPHLRVRGTENLWVADASIMPDHINANINAACMMIGAKLGRQLAAGK